MKEPEPSARRAATVDPETAVTGWSQDQLLDFVAGIDGILWEADADSETFSFVSPSAERILGYPANDWLSTPRFWADHIHPDDRATTVASATKATAAGRDHLLQYRMIARDGGAVWITDNVKVSEDHPSGRRRLRGLMLNVSERRGAEQADLQRSMATALQAELGATLATSESLTSTLQSSVEAIVRHLDAAFARVWTVSEDGRSLELQASAGLYTHLDGPHSRVPIGQFKIGMIAKERQPHLTNAVLDDPRVSDKEWARREGMIAFAGYPLIIEGRLLGVLAMFAQHELSPLVLDNLAVVVERIAGWLARRNAENALMGHQQRLETILDNLPEGVCLFGLDGRTNYANRAAIRILGRPSEQLTGQSNAAPALRATHLDGRPLSDDESPVARVLSSNEATVDMELIFTREDGTPIRVVVSATPVRDASGKLEGVVVYFDDVTEQRRVEKARLEKLDRDHLLAEASQVLISTIDYQETLDGLAALAVPAFADYCLVVDVEPSGAVRHARAHADPEKLPLLEALTRRPLQDESSLAARAIASGEPQLVADISTEQLERAARDDDQRSALLGLAPRSSLFVPLIGREGVLGVIGFALAESGRRYSEADIEFARELAERAANAVERARLFDKERSAHHQAEAAQLRLESIFQTSPVGMALWDRDLRYLAINDALAEINGIPRQDHYGRTMHEVFGDSDPELVRLSEEVIETGVAFIGESYTVNVPGREDRCPGYYDFQHLPMKNPRGEVEGLLAYVVDVTERVNLERERKFMADVSSALSSSLDYEQTARNLAELVIPSLADYSVVFLLGRDKSVDRVAGRHVDPAKQELVDRLGAMPVDFDADEGVGAVLRTGQHILITEISEDVIHRGFSDPERRELIRQLNPLSVIMMPLIASGRILGAILVGITESDRRYGATDVVLAEELARRAALAIENARLYQEAEDALATRNQFLSMASHELKTPITSIKGYSQVLLRKALREGDQSQADILEIIDSETDRMTRLIGELLDVARIERGRLEFDYSEFDLSEVMRASLAQVAIGADDFTFNLAEEGESLVIHGDRMRIEQVVTNLLSNAVKYSDIDRTVDVRLRREKDGRATIEISDKGIGIPPDQQAMVFDLFFRGSNLGGSHRSGMGLGLYISKAIVEAHEGSILVESQHGQGATFRVELPLSGTGN